MRRIKDTILNRGFVLPDVPTHGPKRHNLGHLTGAETGALCIGHDATGQQCSVPGFQWLDHSILMGRHPLDFNEMSIGSCHES